VLAREFAGTHRPFSTPWVSLVLGRRGIELAEAAFGCAPPEDLCLSNDGEGQQLSGVATEARSETAQSAGHTQSRQAAVDAYGQQWAHFLQTQFAPHFAQATRRHRVQQICFAGSVAETNWRMLQEVLLEPGSEVLQALPKSGLAVDSASSKSRRGRRSGPSASSKGEASSSDAAALR
ncbi:unnamed protein product, partial [Polarella glacialis]